MSNSPQFFEIRQLAKRFGAKAVVNNLSMQLHKGEIFALLGASGSGKSTLLRMMAGLLDADSGTITLEGTPIKGPAEHLVPGYDEVKLVSQSFDLMPHHSVEENILHPLRQYKPAYQQQQLKKMLELCQLEQYTAQKPDRLSGGEQQRVAIACALAAEPSLLLLDEPFSHLDVIFRQNLKKVLQRIVHETATTLCFVTHESTDALSIAHRVGVLADGALVQVGEGNSLYLEPASSYVAQLLGEVNEVSAIIAERLGLRIPTQFSQKKILLRPEQIRLTPPTQGRLQGAIMEVRRVSAFFRFELQVEDAATPLVAYQLSDELAHHAVVSMACNPDAFIAVDE